MEGVVEGTTVVMGLPSWQVLTIVFSIIGSVLAGVTVALVGIMRSIAEHQRSINATIERYGRTPGLAGRNEGNQRQSHRPHHQRGSGKAAA